ncbi:hypothetical protein [Streptomyces sp. NPDC059215]|uniref:hypothetical protein n=1 Tax=Streptomyces sp. NPDC059215 TaxID=3346772 RepID=UPI0036C2778F
MNRDTHPALPVVPSPSAEAAAAAGPDRPRAFTRQLRVLAARGRAAAWKLVTASGTEFVKGFANKAGGLVALVLGALVIAYLLDIDPGDAVRSILGI